MKFSVAACDLYQGHVALLMHRSGAMRKIQYYVQLFLIKFIISRII